MSLIKIKGIVVKENVYSESSKILKIFNEDLGIISVISKGCRKPKSNLKEGSSILTLANFDISYKEEGLSNLIGISDITHFKNIVLNYKDIDKKVYAFSILELTEQIINQKNLNRNDLKEIYNIMTSSIKKIDELFNPLYIFDIVLLKYLKYLGVLPYLDGCVICNNKDILTISCLSGGFICKDHYNGEKLISDASLKLIKMFYLVDISKIKTLELDDEFNDVHKFIEEYYAIHTGVYVLIKKKLEIISKTERFL